MTDVIDGPLRRGQPARDGLPTAERQAAPPQEDGHTASTAGSANEAADTEPLIVEPAAIPLRQRLAAAGPGKAEGARPPGRAGAADRGAVVCLAAVYLAAV